MELLNGVHHITFVTADMDRLIAFYQQIFEAKVILDLEEEGLRHAFIQVGPNSYLHPFQIPGIQPPGSQPMFQRGRVDHFALQATSEEAFREIHRRVVAAGAEDADGFVTDMGSLLLFSFIDPDEGRFEVAWVKPDVPVDAGVRRADWTMIKMD